MRVARVWRTSVLAVAALVLGQAAPMAAYADPPPPFASVTSPPGGVVTGIVPVGVSGHTDGTADPADVITSIDLVVDGAPLAGSTPVTCSPVPDPYNCAGSIPWNAGAAAPGIHTLVARMSAVDSGAIDSMPAVMVTVPSPPAPTTVSLTSTDPAGPVTGTAHFSATATIDPASSDAPGTLQLKVGGTPVGAAVGCAATCTQPLSFDSTGFINGSKPVVAVFTPNTGPPPPPSNTINVTFSNPVPTVAITAPASGNVSGVVQVTAHGAITPGEVDSATSLQLFDGGGAAKQIIPCGGGYACDATFPLDFTQKDGETHTLTVKFFTSRHHLLTGSPASRAITSAAVTLHVKNPPPGVTITSPTPGSTVFGTVLVQATGTVDAAQSDSAKTLELFATVGGTTKLADSKTCSGHSCSGPLSWDASGVTGPATLKVVLTTANGATASSSVNVTVVSAPPSSTISAPATGAIVSGVVAIVTTGGTSPTQNDTPATMQLLIDGAAFGAGPAPCLAPAGQHACSVPYTWDTTGLSGAHTLQTRFVTHLGIVVLSAVTTVTVVSPAPTAVISSPADSSTVHRDVTISVAGAVDPTQTDAPASMKLTLDGKPLGAVLACTSVPAAPRTCSASLAWNTLGLTGKHLLVATLTTVNGAVGVSAPRTVYVYGGTVIALPKVPTLRAGKAITIKGRVTALINKSGAAGVRVKILVVPSNGKRTSFYVTTDASGYYKIPFKPAMNTVLEATVAPPAYYGVSHTFTRLNVIPQPSCVLKTKLARNAVGKGVCKLRGMPKGTKLKLQYQLKGKWYTLGTGKAPGTVVPFRYGFKVAGVYHVRLVFAASHVFVATTGPSLKVVVS
jgi:hypothetical protein